MSLVEDTDMVVGSCAEAKFPKYRVPGVLNFAVNEREPAGVDGAERHVGPHIAMHLQGLNACVRRVSPGFLPPRCHPSARAWKRRVMRQQWAGACYQLGGDGQGNKDHAGGVRTRAVEGVEELRV
jgi:hypothetical protein